MPAAGGPKRRTRRGKPPEAPRSGLPDPASVMATTTLISPKGNVYRVLQTNEKDPYEAAKKKKERPD